MLNTNRANSNFSTFVPYLFDIPLEALMSFPASFCSPLAYACSSSALKWETKVKQKTNVVIHLTGVTVLSLPLLKNGHKFPAEVLPVFGNTFHILIELVVLKE